MNRHISIATTLSLIVVAVLLYVPATIGSRVAPAFAQSSPDCANSGSNQLSAEVSRHTHTEGNQVQSQANQCATPKCPAGNTGTVTTEDNGAIPGQPEGASGETQESLGEVLATGSCFPDGEDEPSPGMEESILGSDPND
jgi:hypothetical protein